jgi:cyclopropane-fatty-acyl-phospholipid synthase
LNIESARECSVERREKIGGSMFLEKRFLKVMDQIRDRGVIPLRIELWNGRQFDLCYEPNVTVRIPTPSALRYFISPNLNSLGEAFIEGHIQVEGLSKNVFKVAEGLARTMPARESRAARWLGGRSQERDRKSIEYHYDLDDDFYSLFLDEDMVYSCGYYRDEKDSLCNAQTQKIDHILKKLQINKGERLLDIGCGWGALITRAARKYGALATGITLSKNQFEFTRRKIDDLHLGAQCEVFLCDYRDLNGVSCYDKIASVGMFEHVGLDNLHGYFEAVNRLLKDDGLVLNHGITTSDVESRWMALGAGEFIDRYVFPYGELPHVSLALKEMAGAGLEVLDVESLRRHYALTCEAWSDKLESNRDAAVSIVGERRYRIWQIYLAGCAFAFSQGWMNLYQVLCSKSESTALQHQPLTRDYMYSSRF